MESCNGVLAAPFRNVIVNDFMLKGGMFTVGSVTDLCRKTSLCFQLAMFAIISNLGSSVWELLYGHVLGLRIEQAKVAVTFAFRSLMEAPEGLYVVARFFGLPEAEVVVQQYAAAAPVHLAEQLLCLVPMTLCHEREGSRFAFAKAKASPRMDVDETPHSAAADVQQKGSIFIRNPESFQVFVRIVGSGTRVLWVTSCMTLSDLCGVAGLDYVEKGWDVKATVGARMLGWNQPVHSCEVVAGSRVEIHGRMVGFSRPTYFYERTCSRCRLPGCWATKRSCFRCGLSRADSDRMASTQEPPRVVPPCEQSFFLGDRLLSVVRLNLLLGGNLPLVPLLKWQGNRSQVGDPVQQVIEDSGQNQGGQDQLSGSAVELQRVSDKKAFEAGQAKGRLDNHLHELEQIKERVTQAYATQMRNIVGGRGAVVEFSGDEEGEDDDDDVESVQMDGCEEGFVSADQFFADEPQEDYIEHAKPLPPEGKGDPPPDTILSREPTFVRNRGVKKSQVKSKYTLASSSSTTKAICG